MWELLRNIIILDRDYSIAPSGHFGSILQTSLHEQWLKRVANFQEHPGADTHTSQQSCREVAQHLDQLNGDVRTLLSGKARGYVAGGRTEAGHVD